MTTPLYNRVLLKLSGEALMGSQHAGIDHAVLTRFARQIKGMRQTGVQVGVVLGAGNWCRGRQFSDQSVVDPITGDHMGMLATVMNALALRDALLSVGQPAKVVSALPVPTVIASMDRPAMLTALSEGKVVIFAGGTGNPLVTTDAAASWRAIEMKADVLLKATQVDGVYSADPKLDKQAKRYTQLTFDEALNHQLSVMDQAAFLQCRDHNLPIRVFNIAIPDILVDVLLSPDIGTLVTQA